MKFFKIIIWGVCLFFILNKLVANDTIKVMHYNLMYYGKNTNYCTSTNNSFETKNQNLKTIIQYIKPDIFSVNELDGEGEYPVSDDANFLLDNALNTDGVDYYRKAEFPSCYLANTVFYNFNKLILKNSTPISFYFNEYQKTFNVYQFYFNSSDIEITNDTAFIYCLVAHLKSGSSSGDETQRAFESNIIMDYFETIGQKGNYLILGDLNVYSPNERAFQDLINPENSMYTFYDPVNQIGEWSSNYDFRHYHTQSTHFNGACHSGGGMDDRFDFILASDYIMNGTDHFRYIPNSYKTIGQDGNSFNQSLNISSNTDVPENIAQSLFNMSDHLPVYMELHVDQDRGELLNVIESRIENTKIFYTNPAKDYLNIHIDLGFRSSVTTEIYSIEGNKIYCKQYKNSNKVIEEIIPVSDLPNGMYFLHIYNQNERFYSSRIIIQN